MSRSRRRAHVLATLALGSLACFGTQAQGQTIEGTLMDVESDRPISLGLIIMMTEAGDSVTSAVTDGDGRFTVRSPEPGSFVLLASVFGYKETAAGVFELGPGATMTVEFRVGAEAMPIDGILVELQRPSIEHRLVSNGFVRRLQRGNGIFITPYDIEQSTALSTSDLFRGMPGVSLRSIGGGGNLFSFAGQTIQFLSANGFCTPTLYVDGIRLSPELVLGLSLDNLVPMPAIDAVEIYRRPSEIPIEYSATALQPAGESGTCGVVVLWTKQR